MTLLCKVRQAARFSLQQSESFFARAVEAEAKGRVRNAKQLFDTALRYAHEARQNRLVLGFNDVQS